MEFYRDRQTQYRVLVEPADGSRGKATICQDRQTAYRVYKDKARTCPDRAYVTLMVREPYGHWDVAKTTLPEQDIVRVI